jgi:hypothetical protein
MTSQFSFLHVTTYKCHAASEAALLSALPVIRGLSFNYAILASFQNNVMHLYIIDSYELKLKQFVQMHNVFYQVNRYKLLLKFCAAP